MESDKIEKNLFILPIKYIIILLIMSIPILSAKIAQVPSDEFPLSSNNKELYKNNTVMYIEQRNKWWSIGYVLDADIYTKQCVILDLYTRNMYKVRLDSTSVKPLGSKIYNGEPYASYQNIKNDITRVKRIIICNNHSKINYNNFTSDDKLIKPLFLPKNESELEPKIISSSTITFGQKIKFCVCDGVIKTFIGGWYVGYVCGIDLDNIKVVSFYKKDILCILKLKKEWSQYLWPYETIDDFAVFSQVIYNNEFRTILDKTYDDYVLLSDNDTYVPLSDIKSIPTDELEKVMSGDIKMDDIKLISY